MAHHSRVRGPSDAWANVLPSELAQLDAGLASGINGVDGGTYAPASKIHLGGIAGIGTIVTGPIAIARGGLLAATANAAIALNDNDFPEYASGHSGENRTIVYPCALGRAMPTLAWRARWYDGGMQSIAPMLDQSDGFGQQAVRLVVPIRAHNGATLSSATVNFRIGFQHTTLPATTPSARVVRVSASGVPEALTSSSAGGDANGFVAATKPAALGSWTGNQSIAITCDQKNVVDVTQYTYYVEIAEETFPSGTGYPWQLVVKQPVRVAGHPLFVGGTYGFSPQGLATVDGYSVVNGDRVLLFGMKTPAWNGIWVANSSYWTRASDFRQSTDFSQGVVVPVQIGASYGGTDWQVSSAASSWNTGTLPSFAGTWQASTSFALGFFGLPTPARATGFYYEATASTGNTDSFEPAWPTVVGQTVVDNDVTWTCAGVAPSLLNFVTRGQLDDETGAWSGTQYFAHGNIFQSVAVQFTGITSAAWQ